MKKIIITAEVKDPIAWEKGFRTHVSLFRSQTIMKSIAFGVISGNQVAVCLEPNELDVCMKILQSPATAEAMDFDGVKRETVKMYVLDKELDV